MPEEQMRAHIKKLSFAECKRPVVFGIQNCPFRLSFIIFFFKWTISAYDSGGTEQIGCIVTSRMKFAISYVAPPTIIYRHSFEFLK